VCLWVNECWCLLCWRALFNPARPWLLLSMMLPFSSSNDGGGDAAGHGKFPPPGRLNIAILYQRPSKLSVAFACHLPSDHSHTNTQLTTCVPLKSSWVVVESPARKCALDPRAHTPRMRPGMAIERRHERSTDTLVATSDPGVPSVSNNHDHRYRHLQSTRRHHKQSD
jgi:hypothetical protein